jgi:hypothetical protein
VTATCVDCVDNKGCAGTLDRCNTAQHKCVDCDATGGCGDVPVTPICAQSACRGCLSDAECAAAQASVGPLCTAIGVCAADTPCTGNAGCTDGIHRVCVGLGADGSMGHCRVCDPVTAAGCTAGQTCTPNFVCTG